MYVIRSVVGIWTCMSLGLSLPLGLHIILHSSMYVCCISRCLDFHSFLHLSSIIDTVITFMISIPLLTLIVSRLLLLLLLLLLFASALVLLSMQMVALHLHLLIIYSILLLSVIDVTYA